MDEASASVLERRYRLLLHVYPAAYRAERGDEILGTLLACAPAGRAVPRWRDAFSLVLAGLRVRALQNRGLSMRANIRLVLMLSLAIVLTWWAADRLGLGVRIALKESGYSPTIVRFLGGSADLISFGSASLIAIVLIWLVPRLLSVPILIASGVVTLQAQLSAGDLLYFAILLALIVLTAISPQRPPRSWLLLTAVLPAAEFIAMTVRGLNGAAGAAAALTIVGSVALVWIGTDARPALAVALVLGLPGLAVALRESGSSLELSAAVGLAMVAIVRLRFAPRPARAAGGGGRRDDVNGTGG